MPPAWLRIAGGNSHLHALDKLETLLDTNGLFNGSC
jgi:hypothetical protein